MGNAVFMSEDPLNLTLTGELAAAIRAAAEAAGTSPQEWMQRVVRARLEHPPIEWETVGDANGIFTVPLPRGWQHEVRAVQGRHGRASVYNTHSPDGATKIFGNDPAEGFRPDSLFGLIGGGEDRSAAGFGANYLTKHYGNLPGFRVTGSAPLPELAQSTQQGLAARGLQVSFADAATVSAEFVRDGTPMTLAAVVGTMGMPGGWAPQVMHVVSSGDASSFVPACLHMYTSLVVTPVGQQLNELDRARSQQQHQATMAGIQANTAMMTAGHQQRMSTIASQGAAFQHSMQERQQAFDAGVEGWRDQQAANDASHSQYMGGLRQASSYGAGGGSNDHRNFLNTIKEQETVLDREGWEHQVDAGPDKYYYNDHQQQFIGMEQQQDIHDVPGINPDDWYQTPIQR